MAECRQRAVDHTEGRASARGEQLQTPFDDARGVSVQRSQVHQGFDQAVAAVKNPEHRVPGQRREQHAELSPAHGDRRRWRRAPRRPAHEERHDQHRHEERREQDHPVRGAKIRDARDVQPIAEVAAENVAVGDADPDAADAVREQIADEVHRHALAARDRQAGPGEEPHPGKQSDDPDDGRRRHYWTPCTASSTAST